jgi:hypothetical protein
MPYLIYKLRFLLAESRVQSPDRLTEARWQIVAVMVNRGAMPEISGVIC